MVFGCAEFLMGSHMTIGEGIYFGSYVPFWQGFLVHNVWMCASDNSKEWNVACSNDAVCD